MAEFTDQSYDEKVDAALMAGAEVEDIVKATRGRTTATEVPVESAEAFELEPVSDADFDVPRVSTVRPERTDEMASEAAGYATLLTGGEKMREQYVAIRDQVKETGTHPQIDIITDQLNTEEKRNATTVASMMATEGEIAPESILATAIKSVQDANVSLADAVSERLAAANEPATAQGRSVFAAWSGEAADAEIAAFADVNALLDETAKDLKMSWGMVGDGLLTVLPFYEASTFHEFATHIKMDFDPLKPLLPGELLQDFRKFANNVPVEDLPAFYKDMSHYLRESGGVVGGNEFVRVTMLLDTFDKVLATEDPDSIDWARWALDFGGVLDAAVFTAPLSAGIRGLGKLSKAVFGGRMNRVITANPNVAASLAKSAAADDVVVEALGETQQTLRMKYVEPKQAGWALAQTPEKVRKAILEADEDAAYLLGKADQIEEFVGEEAKLAARELQDSLQNADGSTVWVADTSLVRSETGWKADALVAASDESGWATAEAANAANKAQFDGKGTVIARVTKSEELVPTGRVVNGKPVVEVEQELTEYFLKVEHNRPIVFMDDDFAITAGGAFRSFFFDADSRFAARITNKSNATFDQYKLLENEIDQRFIPLARLGSKDRVTVSKLLSRGLHREKVYNDREIKRLARASGTPDKKLNDVVEAYREARRGFDSMYVLEERLHLQGLIRDGYSATVKGAEGFQEFAKPLSRSQADNVKRVYDPETKSIVDAPDLNDLYKRNGEIVQIRGVKKVDGEKAQYVVRQSSNRLEELPTFTLNFREGWVPTMYKENYFITTTRPMRQNGEDVADVAVIEVAHTRGEAMARIARLQEDAEEGVTYAFKHDRDLQPVEVNDAAQQLARTQGKLFFSKRGERLKHEDGSLGKIQDPLEAAINGARTISKRVAMDDLILDLKTRYVNTFGKLTNGQYAKPASVGDISDPNLAKAASMYEHIQNLMGRHGGMLDERQNLIKLSDMLENTRYGKNTADLLRQYSDSPEIIGWVRARNFEINLGTDYLRQLILQPSQALFTAVLDPLGFVGNFNAGRVITSLAKEPGIEKVPVSQLDSIAKRNFLGYTGAELKVLIKEFRETGLGQAVSSHQVARDSAKPVSIAVSDSRAGKAVDAATKPYVKSVEFLRGGFERGEELNLGAHWVLARKRWAKNNPGKNPADHILEVGGEARSLALSMTQSGDFAYQKGILSIPLQYFSIRHKAFLAMTTNQTLTKGEKAAMALSQVLLWGPEGLGLGFAMDAMRESTGADIPDVVKDGMAEHLMNNAIELANGEASDIDFAGTFSPLKGVLADNILVGVYEAIMNDQPIGDRVGGATVSNFNRITRFTDSVGILLNADMSKVDMDSLGGPAGVAKDDLLGVLSSYNRMRQGVAMMRSGMWQNSKGEDVLPATMADAVLHGTMGLQSNKVEALYEMQQDMSPSGTSRATEMQETANTYYRMLNLIVTKGLEDIEATKGSNAIAKIRERVAKQQQMHNLILASQGADALPIIKLVSAKIRGNVTSSKKDELIQKLSKLHMNNGNAHFIDIAVQEKLLTKEAGENYKAKFDTLTGAQ